jgi:peptidoglycan/xylan/chitin deacetylase (PgdA/CDA1 family)
MPQNRICFVSIDVERDLKEKTFKGAEGLDNILSLFKKYDIPATLFVTGEVLEKYGDLIKQFSQDHEIACHSYTHKFWNELSLKERGEEVNKFISLYQSLFNKSPIGFRAPSHVIDEEGFELIDESGFLYDSSVVPHYPPFKKYRGYKGRKPLSPYRISGFNILEIPNTGQLLGLPLVGTWIRKLPLSVYRILFLIHKPRFISFSMHSWDSLNPGLIFKIEEMIKILKKNNYNFKNGKQILKNRE